MDLEEALKWADDYPDNVTIPLAAEIRRLRAELETERMKLAMKAPITFEVACKAWGDVPSLCDDSMRKCFFAVWALLCFEWAEAMVEHAHALAAKEGE